MKISESRVKHFLGFKYRHVAVETRDQVDSTNLRLKEGARAGLLTAPYLLAADCQTAGRGRLGRRFVSPPDTGLYLSLLCGTDADSGRVTILAAVAVCRAIEACCGQQPKIKWVNDLFLHGRKICGILAEKIDQGVIIGIGVNVKTPPGGFPPEAGLAGAIDRDVDRAQLAGLIGRYLLEGMERPWDPAILAFYRSRMPLVGKEITFQQEGKTKNARVTGVAEDGGLMIRTEDGDQVLRCGEVSLGSASIAQALE